MIEPIDRDKLDEMLHDAPRGELTLREVGTNWVVFHGPIWIASFSLQGDAQLFMASSTIILSLLERLDKVGAA